MSETITIERYTPEQASLEAVLFDSIDRMALTEGQDGTGEPHHETVLNDIRPKDGEKTSMNGAQIDEVIGGVLTFLHALNSGHEAESTPAFNVAKSTVIPGVESAIYTFGNGRYEIIHNHRILDSGAEVVKVVVSKHPLGSGSLAVQ